MSKKVGVVKGDIFLRHDTGWGHPETSERLVAIYEMLDQSGFSKELEDLKLKRASKHEVCLVHSEHLFESVEETASHSQSYMDGDTPASPESFEAALYAAGSTAELAEKVLAGEMKSGFALVRPPGHHAERDRAMGFCLFNNIAIAAANALHKKLAKKIAIIDFDVHHGNGTQNSFYNTDQVLYFSSHRYPFYPGSGHFSEVGQGKGEGFTINVPIPGGMGDHEYDAVYTKILMPIVREYHPDIIMVSAGFDAFHQDPLGGMGMTEHGYRRLASIFIELAEELCSGRLVFVLEGGYSIDGSARCVQEIFALLLGKKELAKKTGKPADGFERLLHEVHKYHKSYWKELKI